MVQRDLFRMLGPTRSCVLMTVLVISGFCAAGLVAYVTQRVIYARIQEHQRVRQYLREVLGETGPERDFHEYACSGDARRPSLREDALNHFLTEVRTVLGKWSQYRWTRRPPVQAKLFPVFEVSVAQVSGARCIVLKEPDRFDGDDVLGMPTIASRKHRQLIAKMGDAKSLDGALEFAWSLRSFGGPPDDALAPLSNFSRTTVSALAAELKGEWRWERFLEAFLLGHLDMSDQTCVIVRSPSYMKHVAAVTAEVKAETVRAYFGYSLHLHLWPFWRLLDGDKEQHEQACAMLTYRLFNFGFVKHFNDTARMGVVAKAGLKEAVVRNSYR
ncbi:hypothetical protein MTO96_033673 [Rhipicephalus appendiculatus]